MKKRSAIVMSPGSIQPIQKGPWVAAAEQIQIAGQALAHMREAKDRMAFEAAWSAFLDATEVFWARLNDDGIRASSRFAPWSGRIAKLRRKDELLCYLSQARHKNQHERTPLEWSEGRIGIGTTGGGIALRSLQIFHSGHYEADYEPTGRGQPELVHEPGGPLLPTITNRGTTFHPPSKHLGTDFDAGEGAPLRAAEAALHFYADVLDKAVAEFPNT
jgi:hypothetical protein